MGSSKSSTTHVPAAYHTQAHRTSPPPPCVHRPLRRHVSRQPGRARRDPATRSPRHPRVRSRQGSDLWGGPDVWQTALPLVLDTRHGTVSRPARPRLRPSTESWSGLLFRAARCCLLQHLRRSTAIGKEPDDDGCSAASDTARPGKHHVQRHVRLHPSGAAGKAWTATKRISPATPNGRIRILQWLEPFTPSATHAARSEHAAASPPRSRSLRPAPANGSPRPSSRSTIPAIIHSETIPAGRPSIEHRQLQNAVARLNPTSSISASRRRLQSGSCECIPAATISQPSSSNDRARKGCTREDRGRAYHVHVFIHKRSGLHADHEWESDP